jgi:hypothetical protein
LHFPIWDIAIESGQLQLAASKFGVASYALTSKEYNTRWNSWKVEIGDTTKYDGCVKTKYGKNDVLIHVVKIRVDATLGTAQ